MVRRAGTTLLEMLVVMALFSLIMTSVLAFYVWGQRTTAFQTRIMDNYRRIIEVVDRLELLVSASQLVAVSQNQIMIVPASEQPIDRRTGNRSEQAVTIVVDKHKVLSRQNGRTDVLLVLHEWETFSFALDPGGNFVDIAASGTPPVASGAAEGESHGYSLTRRILVEPPF